MTRNEFIEEVNSWQELIDFCNDEGCSYCEDVYDEYVRDEYIDDMLVDMARNAEGWKDLYGELENIPTGDGYYIRNDYGEWEEADDYEFDEYKENVLEWADDREVWDDDEEEEDEDCEELEDDAEEVIEEAFTVSELFTSCASGYQKIERAEDEAEKQAVEDFEKLFA